jgi:RNA polymerase sigma-70 factor, ECF subfamily
MTIASTVPLEAEDGDARRDCFVELLSPLLPRAHRLAYGLLRDRGEAEDAVQEAIFKAWRAFGRLRPDSAVEAWFLTIVSNQCRQQRRNRWWAVLKRAEMPGLASRDHATSSDDSADLRRALARLPHDQRLVLVLRYYLDLPLEEVGRVLGISEKAAKARVHRALARLRPEVGEVLDHG